MMIDESVMRLLPSVLRDNDGDTWADMKMLEAWNNNGRRDCRVQSHNIQILETVVGVVTL